MRRFLHLFILLFTLFTLQAWAGVLNVERNDGKQFIFTLSGKELCSFEICMLYGSVILKNRIIKRFEIPFDEIQTIKLNTEDSGTYTLEVYRGIDLSKLDLSNLDDSAPRFKKIWAQDFFIQSSKDRKLSKETIQALALKYAPISSQSKNERFFPTSLEYIFNKIEKDPTLDKTSVSLILNNTDKTIISSFERLDSILSQYGDKDSVLSTKSAKALTNLIKKRSGKGHETIYYSLIPNPHKDEYYLNYHFLYTFDPKLGTPDSPHIAEHAFDRESFTVVLNKYLNPEYIVYGAHLENQMINLVNEDDNALESWTEGRIKIHWREAQKKGFHPLVFLAIGSHAIYPIAGTYTITGKNPVTSSIEFLREDAGGNTFLIPPNIDGSDTDNNKTISYKLKNLEIENITSSSWNKALVFSGSIVDLLGPSNAKFPPYTEREKDSEKWTHGAHFLEDARKSFTDFNNKIVVRIKDLLEFK